MAAANVVTSKEYATGVKIIKIVMDSDDGTAFADQLITSERGKQLVNVSTKAGTPGPTADSDLAVTDDETGRNLVATNGPDSVDNTGSVYVEPETNSIVAGNLTIAVTNNAVVGGITTIFLIFKAKYL